MPIKKAQVKFNTSYSAKCQSCKSLIFQLSIVDWFLIFENKNYYKLEDDTHLDTLTIDADTILTSSFVFLKNIKCKECSQILGYKIHAANIQHFCLLDKVILSIEKFQIFCQQQEFTKKLKQIFDTYMLQEQYLLIKQKQKSIQQLANEQTAIHSIDQKEVQQNQNEEKQNSIQMKRSQPNSSYLEENILLIVNSFNFFANVLSKIERRICDIESVCGLLRKKIQIIEKSQNN